MKTVIEFSYFCLLLLHCHVNINTVFADQSQQFSPLPSITAVILHEFDTNDKMIDKPTQFWNNTVDNITSIIALKNWELSITCQAPYPVEWVTSGTIDTKRPIQVREVWRETEGNRTNWINNFNSRLGQPLVKTGWVRCRSIENHTIATEIFLFVKDTDPGATVFVNSNEYYKHKLTDPKIVPCAVTDPTLSVSLNANGHGVFDAKYDPRLGFMLHDSAEELPTTFQCRVGQDTVIHRLNDSTRFIYAPEESQVSAFENQTLKFVCKSSKKIETTIPTTDENLHVSIHSITENYATISIRGKLGQRGKVICMSDGLTKTWEFEFYITPKFIQEPTQNDFRCVTDGSGVSSLSWIYCKNKNTCEINKNCLDDGKCSKTLNYAKGVALSNNETRLVQPPLSGLIQCSVHGAKEIKEIFQALDDKYYLDADKAVRKNVVIALEVKSAKDKTEVLYSDEEAHLVCKSVKFLLPPDFIFQIMLKNGENITLTKEDYREDESDEFYDEHEKPGVNILGIFVKLTTEMKQITCKAAWDYSSQWYHASKEISVLEPKSPTVKLSKTSTLTLRETSQLICEATGSPVPSVNWKTNTTGFYNVTQGIEDGIVYLTMTFPKVEKAHEGSYICEASNRLGVSKETLHVTTAEPRSLTQAQLYGISFGCSFAILFLIVLTVSLWIRYKTTLKMLRDLTEDEIDQFIKGSPDLIKDFVDVHKDIDHIPYNKDYEIPIKFLDIDRSDVLGSGAFGVVVKGTYKNGPVAVKMTKPNADVSYFKALLSELKIMIYIGHHPNIVTFIGSFTQNIKSRILYIIVEFCPGGNLHSYLRKFEKDLKNDNTTEGDVGPLYANTASLQFKGHKKGDFLLRAAKWSRNIADGCEYLASKKVIHGDLACRNILLASDDVAKVTDFGLSRQLYEYSNYNKKTESPLPWRWMAIESLANLDFSSKSDVWSFGVTLWELYSLGQVPFPGLSWTADFVEIIHKGTRMKQPEYASSEIYEVMCQCWSIIPDKRPSFREISDFFRQLVDEFHEEQK